LAIVGQAICPEFVFISAVQICGATSVDAFFEVLATELAQGQSVKISGFSNFEVHTKTARPGRNPQTGEPVVIAARRVVTFRASGLLRQQVNKEG